MTWEVGLVYHQDFQKYDFGEGHPFRGERYRKGMGFFKDVGVLDKVRLFTPEPVEEQNVLMVHTSGYLRRIREINHKGGPLTGDTYVFPGLYDIARLFAGSNLLAGELILTNQCQRAVVFGLGGHHAGAGYGGGFCIINDVAIMIEVLKRKYHLRRILVFDYDAHCGNGCQDIFYQDPQVLYIDFHQDPRTIYPGVGFIDEIGKGPGLGYTVNVPIPPGTTDASYLKAVHEILVPLATEYKPELIIALGGVDSHFQDPLSSLNISLNGFRAIVEVLSEISLLTTDGRFVIIGSSGYNVDILPKGWYALLCGIIGLKDILFKESEPIAKEPDYVRSLILQVIQEVRTTHAPYWSSLR